MAHSKPLGVGILGCGEVAQVIHLPTLSLLNHLYTIISVCDISPSAVAHCAAKFHVPHGATNPKETINHELVDVVFNLTSDDQHVPLTIAALRAGKHVMLEKPVTLSLPAAHAISEAEREAKAKTGAKLFVGYMRRYAPSFVNAFKNELKDLGPIKYARVRDIVGPNSYFVSQSGAEPIKFTDYPDGAGAAQADVIGKLVSEAWDGKKPTAERIAYTRFLGSLGSHDLSLMREALGGLSTEVVGVAAHGTFYNALMTYKNADGSFYAVSYESGVDDVPRFDAHLTVYGQNKTVRIQYDTPYVKGLPIVVHVDEKGPNGEKVSRTLQSSFEDAYTAEMRELWSYLVENKEIKTTLEDALDDLKLFDMMYKTYDRQNNTT